MLAIDRVVTTKGIIYTIEAIFGNPVFIKQGSNITAELGNLIADGDIIVVSQSSVFRRLVICDTFSHSTVQRC